jgi:hypothetical protein
MKTLLIALFCVIAMALNAAGSRIPIPKASTLTE